MRGIKKRNPERYCVLEYDKLFVDHKVYVWNDILGQVVEMNDSERSLDPVTRAASAMGRGARPGLSKSWSVSSPNMPGIMDNTETDILERIRDLEAQIAAQQVQPSSRMLRLPSKNLFQQKFSGNNSLSTAADLRVWRSEGWRIRESVHLIILGLGSPDSRRSNQHGKPLSVSLYQWRPRINHYKDTIACLTASNEYIQSYLIIRRCFLFFSLRDMNRLSSRVF